MGFLDCLPWTIYSYLSSLSCMLLVNVQLLTVARSSCSLAESSWLEIVFESLVSSANDLQVEFLMLDARSLTKRRNSRGPRTVPWGTPL